jgi:hypothetical protein
MNDSKDPPGRETKVIEIPPFSRDWQPAGGISRIGTGQIGGKARGLLVLSDVLSRIDPGAFVDIDINVPTFTVLATDVFDAFMDRNRLHEIAQSEESDERIAHAFQKATLPTEVLGDFRALTELIRWPLAIRSSSRLEDALFRPFAGVYETKMTPNNQPDANTRFQKLTEGIKFVYASTFFSAARDYLRTLPGTDNSEKMAVIIQDMVGARHQDRFYPALSGVARSFNFYPSGGAPREDGVVDLALGLGKIIVDEGMSYPYVPSRPKSPPPFASVRDLLQTSQTEFWAVNMGKPPAFDPIRETEYLVRANLADAEYDGTLRYLASTYDPASDRVYPGVGRDGARVLNFAPLLVLEEIPLNPAVSKVMEAGRADMGWDVEVEFAMTIPGLRQPGKPSLGFVQVRPMVTSDEVIEIAPAELSAANLLLASNRVMGNGKVENIQDIVYTKPKEFDLAKTRSVADQLARVNSGLQAAGRPYLLIGFGRWGSSDPWLGIPVKWGQVSGARAVVEATLPERVIEASQGSHFFHNITSFGVSYFHVGRSEGSGIQWDWLESREAEYETELVRHIRLDRALIVKVDGRTGRGGIWLPE